MSYNGSGTFQINTSGQPVVAGTVISSTAFNALTADLATGLSTAITKDGQTTATARIPFAQGITSTLVTDSSSVSTGSIITAGGLGVAKALYVGTTANVGSTTDSSSISTGSIVTAGGIGVAKNLYVGVNANVAGTLGVTGVATFSAAPIYSSLTASSAVATDASKGLVSVTNTGTGNNVLATSPNLVTPILGTPTSGTLTNCTGLPTTALTGTITEANGGTGTTTGYYGFKNRIINGAMVIAQRGTSTSLVAGNSSGFAADRFQGFNVGAGACSIIQATNTPSSTYGFINSLQIDVTTADASIAAGDLYMIRQTIEGLNIADLAWGTANAKTITLSFWVSSPKTGTHFVAFKNQAQDRCYAASYTVSVADTWEQKTITVAGDTSGTWLTTNSGGIQVVWALAIGSTFQTATADVWAAGDGYATSAQVNVMDSTANNFYITGVQLEKGSTATSFDYRPYGTEFALCQRYYETGLCYLLQAPGSLNAVGQTVGFRVTKRATPTLNGSGGWSSLSNCTANAPDSASVDQFRAHCTSSGAGVAMSGTLNWQASIEL